MMLPLCKMVSENLFVSAQSSPEEGMKVSCNICLLIMFAVLKFLVGCSVWKLKD